MPTLYSVLSTLEAAVIAATAGLTSSAPDSLGKPITVLTGIGWPSQRTLQNNVRKGPQPQVLVTIYDRGLARDTTRWKVIELARTVTTATMTAAVSNSGTLPGLGTATIQIGGPITPNDAVAVVFSQVKGTSNAVVQIAGATDTPNTVAANLAAALNSNANASPLMRAAATNNVVTLTSLIATPITFTANVGNGASRVREIGRRERHLQVVLWTRTEDDRNTIGAAIETEIATLEADFGLTFPDGTLGRLLYAGDQQFDDATLADTYRRDFMVSVEYPITTTDAIYAVLAPIVRNTTF